MRCFTLKTTLLWVEEMEEDKMVGVLFCDQSAAFDLCDHDILIEKLRLMGVEDTALNWIRSYLSNRKQSCLVDGEMSPSRIVAYHRAVLEGHCCGYALPVTNLTLFIYMC